MEKSFIFDKIKYSTKSIFYQSLIWLITINNINLITFGGCLCGNYKFVKCINDSKNIELLCRITNKYDIIPRFANLSFYHTNNHIKITDNYYYFVKNNLRDRIFSNTIFGGFSVKNHSLFEYINNLNKIKNKYSKEYGSNTIKQNQICAINK
jgi:hypothetical protein